MTAYGTITDQLCTLERLQELDLQIDRAKLEVGAIPAALKAMDDSIASLVAKAETFQSKIAQQEQFYRQNKGECDLNAEQIRRSTERLEGVQNAHELAALQKELAQLKAVESKLTEAMKLAQTEIAQHQASLEANQNQLEAKRSERSERIERDAGKTEKLQKEVQSLELKRAELAKAIEPRVLNVYNRVRVQKAGIGVSLAVTGRCKACNMMIPPQAYNELIRGTVFHQCSTCHRFLYIPAKTG